MISAWGYAAQAAHQPLAPLRFERRAPRPHDVVVDIEYCGVCHSDIHLLDNDWGRSHYPMIPGHEIVGRVVALGSEAKRHAIGDRVGIGYLMDSCRQCSYCQGGDQHFCDAGFTGIYNAIEPQSGAVTYGGFSNTLVIDENFAAKISPTLDPAAAAPLLCAGITTYSALKKCGAAAGKRMGLIGLGGLGHMAIKFGHAFGMDVTLFTSSPDKAEDARRLGAAHIESSRTPDTARLLKQFDFIIDTVSAPHALNPYFPMLKPNGTLCMLGMPPSDSPVNTNMLTAGARHLAGSSIGGMRETQEMLDFCAQTGVVADVEVVGIAQINEAFERLRRNDIKYRFVVDMRSVAAPPV